ncbi:MAG: tetratricopeptide repeat protein [Selenomonadaceae bacterium]|nr:tetratricopeptide repeat protein [Selenomonadaceae bacterium]
MLLYEEAIVDNPNYARSYSRRGHIYRQQGKNDLARRDCDKAYALDPKEAGAHYGKAIYL